MPSVETYSYITNLVLAPSNEEAVFVQTSQSEHYLMHINLQTEQLTKWVVKKGEIHQVAWSPDGRCVAFLSMLDGENQLYTVNDQQVVEQLTTVVGGVNAFYWSPCSKKLWLTLQQSGGIVSLDRVATIIEPFMSGNPQQLLAVSHSGQQIVSYDKVERALYMIDIETKERICMDTIRRNIQQLTFSFTDQYIAYVGQDTLFGSATHPAIYVYDTAMNFTQNMTEMLDAPVGDVTSQQRLIGQDIQKIAWTETDAFYFQLSVMGDVRLYYADLYGSIFPASPEEQYVINYSVASSGNWALMTVSTPTVREQLVFFDITTGQQRVLASLHNHLDLIESQSIIIETANGDIHGWLMQAPLKQGATSPLIIKIPAPYEMLTSTYDEQNQRYVQAGNSVFSINPRGSSGYGQLFAHAIEARIEDLIVAVDYALANWTWVNPDEFMLVEGSHFYKKGMNRMELMDLLENDM